MTEETFGILTILRSYLRRGGLELSDFYKSAYGDKSPQVIDVFKKALDEVLG